MGEQDIVVKPLGAFIKRIKGIAGVYHPWRWKSCFNFRHSEHNVKRRSAR
jgi:hypothetical protein